MRRLCARTHWHLYALAFARAFAPALAWILAAAILVLSGVYELAPAWMGLALTLIFHVGAIILLVRAAIRMKRPDFHAACRAVDALMEGAPATSQIDNPAQDAPEAGMLWNAHVKRMALAGASLAAPDFAAEWKRLDPWRLRRILPAACLLAALMAGGEGSDRLYRAMLPNTDLLFGAHKLRLQAWIAPPAYTGRAPIALVADGDAISAPQGSELVVRVEAPGQPKLRLGNGATIIPQRGDDGVYESKMTLDHDMTIDLHYWGRRGSFVLNAIADAAPTAAIKSVAAHDDNVALEWTGADDYGIKEAFALIAAPDADDIETRLELPGPEPQQADETITLDLTRHPFAGMEVMMRIRLVDAAGQSGLSAPVSFGLPEKLFLDPLAAAIAEIRGEVLKTRSDYAPVAVEQHQDIAPEMASRIEAAPRRLQRTVLMLDALSHAPQGHIKDLLLFMGMRHARSALNAATNLNAAHDTEDVLWQTALRAELGNLASAKKALDSAREALEQALRDGAPDEKVEQLIDALRAAIQRYLQALVANAKQMESAGQGGSSLSGQDLEEMLKALSELAETGARDDARRLLSDMARLLERMQNARFRRGDGNGGPGAGEPEPNDHNAQEMSDLLRDQRELNDKTFSRNRRRQDSSDLAERQGRLSERLKKLQEQAKQDGINKLLDQALQAQKQAERALRRGDGETAAGAQRDAAKALREAITKMAENADGDTNRRQGRDPLGRQYGGGADDGDGVQIPDRMERMRAREFLDELRRRSETPLLPQQELEYLERLLRRF